MRRKFNCRALANMQINVIEYFEKGALLKFRDKVAIIEQSARYMFAEIERFAKNCAALILKQNAAVKRPVAVFLPKSARAIIADLGILYSGNCYANLDAKSPPERLKSLLQNLGASVIITSASHAATLRALGVPDDQLLLVDQGLLRVSPLGDGSIRCVSERAARELYLELIRKSPDYFIEKPFSAQRADKTFTAHNMVAL
jgi:acyl-CoA synthetase (AMP-forming)/AMP-acid ligase II